MCADVNVSNRDRGEREGGGTDGRKRWRQREMKGERERERRSM